MDKLLARDSLLLPDLLEVVHGPLGPGGRGIPATLHSAWRRRRVLRLHGEEHETTIVAACNYAESLHSLQRFDETRSVMRKMMPVARRVLGDSHLCTIQMRTQYARAIYYDACTSLDDLREAVTTLDETVRISRRVLGGAHSTTEWVEGTLRTARAVIRARETPPRRA